MVFSSDNTAPKAVFSSAKLGTAALTVQPEASFTFVPPTSVLTRDEAGIRTLSATFGLRQTSGNILQNIMLVAYNQASSNVGGTAVKNIFTFGGTASSSNAQSIKPAHGTNGSLAVDPFRADMGILLPLEANNLTIAARNAGVIGASDTALEYGFIARRSATSHLRSIFSGSMGQVTLAVQLPTAQDNAATTAPYRFALTFIVSTDDIGVVTQSQAEQNNDGLVLARARGVGSLAAPALVRIMTGSSYALSASQALCGVRTANPLVATQGFTLDGRITSSNLTPAPNTMFNPINSSVTATFPSLLNTNLGLTVRGLQSGTRSSGYLATGNNLIQTNSQAFFPSEEVEVAQTQNISTASGSSSCRRVSRFRVASLPKVGSSIPSVALVGQNFAIGLNSELGSLGDFNNDGNLDTITSDQSANTVVVRLGNGQGGFTTAPNLSFAVIAPSASALGDLNGDGNLDAMIATFADGVVAVKLGNGDGTFSSAPDVIAGNAPKSLALGDFNNDGQLDAAVVNLSSNDVSVLIGNGLGGFAKISEVAVGAFPIKIEIGDFNNDGSLDAMVFNLNSSSASVLIGNGFGGFVKTTDIALDTTLGNAVTSIALGDLNGDNKLDALAVSALAVLPLLGNGQGGFSFGTKFSFTQRADLVSLGDLNGDGKLDAALPAYTSGSKVQVLIGDGLGGFSNPVSPTIGGNFASAVELGDFNNDRALDILTITDSPSGVISVLLNATKNFANALNFGGSRDAVVSATDNTLTSATAQSYTVETWVKIPNTAFNQNETYPIVSMLKIGKQPFNLFFSNGKIGLEYCGTKTGSFLTCDVSTLLSSQLVNDNQWHHLAFVRNAASSLTLYLDGVLAASATDSTDGLQLFTPSTLLMGRNNPAPGFGGVLDEVRIWNVARTSNQVQQDALRELNAPYPTNLVAYFKLDSPSGTTALNEITDGSSGTLVNFPAGNPWQAR